MKDKLRNLEFLYDARRSQFGIVIETSNAERLRQHLYALRRENEEFTPLSFVISPMNGADLWIVNKGSPDAEEQ